jgi:hypothetical protein
MALAKHRPSDNAVVDGAADVHRRRPPATLEHDAEGPAGLVRSRDHPVGLGEIHGHRLFHQDVFAGPHGADGQLGVARVRGCHRHQLDRWIRQQFVDRGVRPAAVLLRDWLQSRFVRVADGHQFGLR